jgi:integrase/recombinase XerC
MVFIGEKCGNYGEKTLNQQFKKLAKKLGLPDGVHPHTLRHTTASLLINSDIPAKVVSEQLGHATTGITQD